MEKDGTKPGTFQLRANDPQRCFSLEDEGRERNTGTFDVMFVNTDEAAIGITLTAVVLRLRDVGYRLGDIAPRCRT